MKTVLITDEDQFAALESGWNVLLAASGTGSCHSTFEWLFTWWKHFQDGKQLLLVAAMEDNALIGVAPFFLEYPPAAPATLHFLGEGLSDYADVLTLPDRPEIPAALLDTLLRESARWGAVDLEEIPEWSKFVAFYETLATVHDGTVLRQPTVRCPYLPIVASWDEFLPGLSKAFRHDLQNKRNRCARDGLALRYRVRDTVDDALLARMMDLSAKRQASDQHRSPFLRHPDQEFLLEALPLMGRHDLLRIGELEDGGRLVAFVLAYRWQGTIYDWNTQYDPDYQRYSVGRIVLASFIEGAFNAGYREFDFMRGEEAYKFQWTPYTRSNVSVRSLPEHQ